MQRGERIVPIREDCVYTSCYCEENIWKLCDYVRTWKTALLEHLFVVFISNEKRMVPLWKQKSRHGDLPVIWVCDVTVTNCEIMAGQSDPTVYDLDSELSFPCSLKLYAAQAFRSDSDIRPEYHRKLRVVPADSFLLNFASDRSHMRNSDGSWKMPPPPYPPICTAECQMNLDDFISMDPAVGWGTVFSMDHFLQRYTGTPSSSSSSSLSSSSSAAKPW